MAENYLKGLLGIVEPSPARQSAQMPPLQALLESGNASAVSYNPTLRERIGDAAYDALRSIGLQNIANRGRNEIQQVVDYIPIAGDAVGFDDAANDYKAGNYGMAAAGFGLSAAGMIPGAGDAISAAGRKGIRAYHGSPHSFDKFLIDKIGTGEGAQAYGRGLYFAENEDVAKSYRDVLTSGISSPEMTAARILDLYGGDMDKAMSHISRSVDSAYANRNIDAADRSLAVKRHMLTNPNLPSTTGHMYEVNIDADPRQMLDWDAPYSSQPKAVKEYFGSEAAYDVAIEKKLAGHEKELSSRGVPGVKYNDAGSRGDGNGTQTRNYVVFDDGLINVVRKYGIAGALAAGLLTREQAAQMEQMQKDGQI